MADQTRLPATEDNYKSGMLRLTLPLGGASFSSITQQDRVEQIRLYHEARESFRREAEHQIGPMHERALSSDKSAIDLALSSIKTSILANAGGIVAIQAAVPLFQLDRPSVQWSLIGTAVWFGGGLFCAWLASSFGFHALALRTNAFEYDANGTLANLLQQYHPNDPQVDRWTAQESELRNKAQRLWRFFWMVRYVAITSLWVSVVLFLVGAAKGACTVTGALLKASPPNSGVAALCKWL